MPPARAMPLIQMSNILFISRFWRPLWTLPCDPTMVGVRFPINRHFLILYMRIFHIRRHLWRAACHR